jgi:predicted protein tyrosine phosphatase
MESQSHGPIPNSYWVQPGKLLAGEYPGARDGDQARAKLHRLLEAEVSFFLDLTEAGEYHLKPYAHLLKEEAAILEHSIEYHRTPIKDWHVPTPEVVKHILDTIDTALYARQIVYVHCFAGIGRTGTVVGCYLVRHGLNGESALAEIARLRQGLPNSWMASPEAEIQRQMVQNWQAGE